MAHILDTLEQRGFISQCTDKAGLQQLIDTSLATGQPLGVYLGIDPTATSMHIGHTTPLYLLKHLHDAGLRVVTLMGGGTGRIGDPSGRVQERQLLDDIAINKNVESIALQCERFFRYDGHTCIRANNAEWLNNLEYISFLRDIGRHFSVNRMLSFESYKRRLETGLSFIEFNYQLLQSYDFLILQQQHNCLLQIGGDDQWGNIVAGIDLIRRVNGLQAYGLTCPLITTASGQKMGKSERGAVFLDANLTSVFDFFQYWRNTADVDVNRFLKMFTFIPIAECDALTAEGGTALNTAKERLALEVTTLIHGDTKARQALQAAQALFSGEGSVENIPQDSLSLDELRPGIELAELLVRCGLATSKGEARKKFIGAGAVTCNHQKITDPHRMLSSGDITKGSILLRVGKKQFFRYVVQE